MKLTKGTRVRLTSDVDALRRGAVGVVLENYIESYDGQVEVYWDYFSSGWGDGNSGWCVYAKNLEVVEPWMPKEGDEVVITKSSKNWNEGMDQFDGRRVVVTRVAYVNTVGVCIKFADCGYWNWCLEWGHFKKADVSPAKSASLDVAEPWMPKEGDEVVITKSKTSWNDAMDVYDGRRVVVTHVAYVNGVGICIKFADDGCWTWCLEWGHFKKAPANTSRSTSGEVVSSEDDLFILTNSGVKLRAGDSVVITRGFKAWNSDMERLVGKVVKISKIVPSEFGSQSHRIIFKEGGNWAWSYDCGHFVSCDEHITEDCLTYNLKSEVESDINFFNEKNKSVVTQKEIEKLTEIQTFNF